MEKPVFGKADLHIHSCYSHDAFSSTKDIFKRAKEAGLDLIAITDHDTIEGAKEALSLSSQFGINVIVGQEIETTKGDIIGLFIKDTIGRKISPLDAIREIHGQGGLVIIPHPFNIPYPFNCPVGGLSFKSVLEIFKEADGIELFNAGWGGWIGRKKAQKLNLSIFNLAPTGSSDAHIARQVGRAYTIFEGKTVEDLYFSIKNRTTKPGGVSCTLADKIVWLLNAPKILFKKRIKI